MAKRPTVERETWSAFRTAGLLWWVNRILHLFGWVIVVELNDDQTHVKAAYPARTLFRGFSPDCETEGFRQLTEHMLSEPERLLWDTAAESEDPGKVLDE